jgi:hypothetical protein
MKTMLALTLVFSAATVARANDAPVPPLEDCGQISTFTNAWGIDFKSDGSGHFQYGSLPFDGGSFPKGTVDFAKLYQSLTSTLVAEKPTPKTTDATIDGRPQGWFHVGFGYQSDPNRRAAGYTTEVDALEQAFKKGIDALDPHQVNHLEFLLLGHDPFHGTSWLLKPEDRAAIAERVEGFIKKGAKGHEQIAINTRSGWKLLINADGSGELSIGRHPSLTATFGAATFDFADVYETQVGQPAQDTLRPAKDKTREPRKIPWDQAIVSVKAPKQPLQVVTFSVRNPTSIKELFDRAWASATLPTEAPPQGNFLGSLSMKDAWEKRPPVELKVAPK